MNGADDVPVNAKRSSSVGTAVLLMTAATACYTSLDTVLKFLAPHYSLGMIVFGRNLAQTILLLALAPIIGFGMFRTAHPLLQVMRGALLIVTTIFIMLALVNLPMAQTYALVFSTPLIATVVAFVFLREKPLAIQWILIVTGFLGIILALRPGTPEFGPVLAYPLIMAAANAVFYVMTRYVARTDSPMSSVFWASASATALAGMGLPFYFEPIAATDLPLFCLAGALGTSAHMLMTSAFRRASTAVVTPIIYTQIVWAVLIGYFLFDEVPDAITLAGAIVVAGSGIALSRIKSA